MFLFDLIANGIVLIIFGGGSVIAYYDYRKGFPLGKSLLGRAEKIYLRLSSGKPKGPVGRTRNAVMVQEISVERLRKSVASIAATSQVASEEFQQQILLAKRFESVKMDALVKGDEESAQAAASGELEAFKRASIQSELSNNYGTVAKYLEIRLDQQEQELLLLKDKKVTIEVRSQATDGMNNLYKLLSEVESETGVPTPRLVIEEELKKSRHEELTAANLITLAEKRRRLQGKELLQSSVVPIEQIQKEINSLQKRIALPEKAGESVN